jgi:predicted AAA+ superfamily ATPase
MIKRTYTKKLKRLLKSFPVVAVIGARQVGKTTLCRDILPGKRRYYNLDDITTLDMALKTPEAILDSDGDMIIDEVQRAPSLLLEIKKRVDARKDPGKYLITGSANIEFLPKLQETLAGRVAFLEIYPITLHERRKRSAPPPGLLALLDGASPRDICSDTKTKENIIENILFGSYPEPLLKKDMLFSQAWFDGYVKTYIERDVRDISNIQSLGDYQRVLALTALRIGSTLSMSELSRDCGVPLMTLKRYLNLLFISYQYHLLQPFHRNIGKRLVKSPKIYSFDGGLSAHLLGISDIFDVNRLNKAGALFENKIVTDLKALLSVYAPNTKISFYRSHGGGEIDIVVERPGQLIPIEIKYASGKTKFNTKTMENFLDTFKDADFGIILSQSDQFFELKKRIFVVPYKNLLC